MQNQVHYATQRSDKKSKKAYPGRAAIPINLLNLDTKQANSDIIINDITAIVDYAHTPDALKNVLQTINEIRTKNEDLIAVVGCGGDRDKTKRPMMGHIASVLSSKVIFTSDNPRSENPETIISQMGEGVEPQNFKKIIAMPCSFGAHNCTINGDNFGFASNFSIHPCTGGPKLKKVL